MKSLFHKCFSTLIQIRCFVLAIIILFPQVVLAECKEFKLVEYADRVEVVCVGEPLTEAQMKAKLAEDKRQEAAAAQRQRVEELQRQRATEAASRTKTAEERNKLAKPKVEQKKPVIKNTINPNKF